LGYQNLGLAFVEGDKTGMEAVSEMVSAGSKSAVP
jgi:hypothetical protein